MLALYCCSHDCGVEQICDVLLPHTASFDCERYKARGSGVGGDEFCHLFQRLLPPELRSMCLDYCAFHRLVNRELWLSEEDPYMFKKLFEDRHLTNPKCSQRGCEKTAALILARDHIRLGVSCGGLDSLPTPAVEREDLSSVYGAVQRYPCFYYRHCTHVDHHNAPSSDELAVADRWSRLGRSTGSHPSGFNRATEQFLRCLRPDFQFMSFMCGPSWTFMKRPVDGAQLRLEPGTYYWDFVNHSFEDALEAVEGDPSWLSHLHTDPHAVVGGRTGSTQRIYMSLSLRRVVHPELERDDVFQTIKVFGDNTDVGFLFGEKHIYLSFGGVEDRRADEEAKNVRAELLVDDGGSESASSSDTESNCSAYFSTDDFLIEEMRFEPHVVYSNALTPLMDICVYSHVDPSDPTTIDRFRISCPTRVQIHSMESNKSAVRINFYIDTRWMVYSEKAQYGAALVKAVTDPQRSSYGFIFPDGPNGFVERAARRTGYKTFVLFYEPERWSTVSREQPPSLPKRKDANK